MAGRILEHDDDGVMAEINMTPLVDVMLVLLIIFMITMPVVTRQLPVTLPEAAAAVQPDPEPALLVSVVADGGVQVDGDPVAPAELARRLASEAQARPDATVHLAADASVPYGDVMRVMDQIRAAGLNRLGFLTRPPAS